MLGSQCRAIRYDWHSKLVAEFGYAYIHINIYSRTHKKIDWLIVFGLRRIGNVNRWLVVSFKTDRTTKGTLPVLCLYAIRILSQDFEARLDAVWCPFVTWKYDMMQLPRLQTNLVDRRKSFNRQKISTINTIASTAVKIW